MPDEATGLSTDGTATSRRARRSRASRHLGRPGHSETPSAPTTSLSPAVAASADPSRDHRGRVVSCISRSANRGNRSGDGVDMQQPGGATYGRCIARLPCQTRFGRRPLRGESGVRTKGAGRLALTSLKAFCKPGLCSSLRTCGICDGKRPAGRRLVDESCAGHLAGDPVGSTSQSLRRMKTDEHSYVSLILHRPHKNGRYAIQVCLGSVMKGSRCAQIRLRVQSHHRRRRRWANVRDPEHVGGTTRSSRRESRRHVHTRRLLHISGVPPSSAHRVLRFRPYRLSTGSIRSTSAFHTAISMSSESG